MLYHSLWFLFILLSCYFKPTHLANIPIHSLNNKIMFASILSLCQQTVFIYEMIHSFVSFSCAFYCLSFVNLYIYQVRPNGLLLNSYNQRFDLSFRASLCQLLPTSSVCCMNWSYNSISFYLLALFFLPFLNSLTASVSFQTYLHSA